MKVWKKDYTIHEEKSTMNFPKAKPTKASQRRSTNLHPSPPRPHKPTCTTVHVTLLQAWCDHPYCGWQHRGTRSQIRATQHATENGHKTTFQRTKEISYTPSNLKA